MTHLHMGINMGHDRSVAVVQDGQVKVAIEQERLDRIKHSVGFMYQAPGEMRHIPGPRRVYPLLSRHARCSPLGDLKHHREYAGD